MLTLEEVTAGYGPVEIIRRLRFSLAEGEVVGLLGRNGTGKTTTIRTVLGQTTLHAGTISLDGRDLTRLPPHRIPRQGIAVAPQGRRVFGELSVRENLLVGWPSPDRRAARLPKILSAFPALRARLDQRAHTLSGGEVQMLALARALLAEPRLVLLDEPTEGLMPQLVRELERQVRALRERGLGVLLAEQRLDTALALCDRVLVLAKGEIIWQGEATADRHAELERHLGVRLQSERGDVRP